MTSIIGFRHYEGLPFPDGPHRKDSLGKWAKRAGRIRLTGGQVEVRREPPGKGRRRIIRIQERVEE